MAQFPRDPKRPCEIAPPKSAPMSAALPHGPGPLVIIQPPPERLMLPPKLWAKIAQVRTATLEEEIDETRHLKDPQVRRKRGRPRKNPLPDPNEYVPKGGGSKPRKSPERPDGQAELRADGAAAQGQRDAADELEGSENNEMSEEVGKPVESFALPEVREMRPPEVTFPDSEIAEVLGWRNDEFLVRVRGKSYQHAFWLSRDLLLERGGEEILKCCKHFGIPTAPPYFNPLFIEPEYVLDVCDATHEVLVKWTGLDYKYSTWERNIKVTRVLRTYTSLKTPIPAECDPDVDLSETFSLDGPQYKAVEDLYERWRRRSDCCLYGNIGSILRLEFAVLLRLIVERNGILGPFLLVTDATIVELVANEMHTYTDLIVLKITNDDPDEFQAIRRIGFTFENNNPKFNICVVASTAYQNFLTDFPRIQYALVSIDGSEYCDTLPSTATLNATFHLMIKKRESGELEIDSQDDSTFLHKELTLFCPMLRVQREKYVAVLAENIEILSQPPEKVDKSKLYEAVMHLILMANFPTVMQEREFIRPQSSGGGSRIQFDESGKIRVLRALIDHSHETGRRLMVMCSEFMLLDLLERYFESFGIPYVRIQGSLGIKRTKLEDFKPEAKVNKRYVVLAQFTMQAMNWLSLMIDMIVVMDGANNPMYYFSHGQRKPKKRDCLFVRLLTADSHDIFLAGCADHYPEEEVPYYDIFRAAAMTFLRPVRETAEKRRKFPFNNRFNSLFSDTGIDFQFLFDEETPKGVVKAESPAVPPPSAKRAQSKKAVKVEVPLETPIRRQHRRVRKARFRVTGELPLPPKPAHGTIVIRRHKRHRGPGLKLVEFPPADQLTTTDGDRTHIWTVDQLNSLLIVMSRFAWGQWARFAIVRSPCSPLGVRECCLRLLRELSKVSENRCPIVKKLLVGFSPVLPAQNFENFVRLSLSKAAMIWRLTRIESMIWTNFLICHSTEAKLVRSIWHNGYSTFSGDSVPSQKFESLIHEAKEKFDTFVVPHKLPDCSFPASDGRLIGTGLRDVVRLFGFLNYEELVGLSDLPVGEVMAGLNQVLLDLQTVNCIDFFDRLRGELHHPGRYFTEDFQFLGLLSRYGTATLPVSSSGSLNGLRQQAEQILENPAESVGEAVFDSIGGYSPILPFRVSPKMVVMELGKVDPRFADQDNIFPVGFTSQVIFTSILEQGKEALYESTIIDGGDRPIFQVILANDRTICFQGNSPDQVWKDVLMRAQCVQQKKLFVAARTPGLDLFGLASATALRFIQALSGAANCSHYRPKVFKVPFFTLQKTGVLMTKPK
jgi:hypothetical protein